MEERQADKERKLVELAAEKERKREEFAAKKEADKLKRMEELEQRCVECIYWGCVVPY